MFSVGKKTSQLWIATGVAIGILALGACSGGGNISNPVALPGPQIPTVKARTFAVNPAGMTENLPALAGFSESITLPTNNAAAGTNLHMVISSLAPRGMPALAPDMHVAIPFLYFTLSTNKDVTLNGFPGFKISVPASFNMGNLPVKIGYYDPQSGWRHIGNFTLSGRTATFTPTTTAITLRAGVTYYALPYTCGGPSPSPTPTGVISCTASGTGAIGVLCVSNKTYAFLGKGTVGGTTIEQVDISGGASASSTAAPFHTYSTSYNPTECSGDEKHLRVFCGSFFSSKLTDIDGSANTSADFDTGTPGHLSFSGTGGAGCKICAIAFDPMDTAFIILDANVDNTGQFQRVGENSHAIDMTITDPDPNENPGYDYVKNWIYSPGYNTNVLKIADFTNGKLFATTSSISNMSVPDSASVDVATHVAETGNEFTPPDVVTLADLGTASESGSTLTVITGQTTLLHSTDEGLDDDASAADSVLHVAFFAGEFGTNLLGFGLLPTTSAGTSISNWAFAKFPNTPDGGGWFSAFDPHPIAAFNDPVNCPDCALSINGGFTWLAVIDLNKLIAAPRSASDTHIIDPTYDLIANHVLAYYKI